MRAVTSACSAALLLCSSDAFMTPLKTVSSAASDRLAYTRRSQLPALVSSGNTAAAPEMAYGVVSDFARNTVQSVKNE